MKEIQMISEEAYAKIMDVVIEEMDKKWGTMGDPDRETNQQDYDLGYYQALERILDIIENY